MAVGSCMEHALTTFLETSPTWMALGILVLGILVLSKGADLLVNEAVALSVRLNISAAVIGATVVSLGTTLPEVAVSVMAAIGGEHEIALGNAVGSIICDTGLILGLGAILRPLPLDRRVVDKQGWIQLGSGLLLVAVCTPWSNLAGTFTEGGRLPQWGGWVFVGLLVCYIIWSLKSGLGAAEGEEVDLEKVAGEAPWKIFVKLAVGIALVILASKAVIPSGEVLALRMGVPPEVVSASLIALGTSLPELVTVVGAVLKGRGDLAVGNVIGADILNVLFVAGVSASVTAGGLEASPVFFLKFFPFMIGLLIMFRIGIVVGRTHFTRAFGVVLLAAYAAFLWLNYQ